MNLNFNYMIVKNLQVWAKKYLNQRPFNLTRSAYSGVQRYAAVWTGDNVSNDEHSVDMTTSALIERFYDGVPSADMGESETFYANKKAKELVGFAPKYSWRTEMSA